MLHFGHRVAWGDVLGAVPVERHDINEHQPFDLRLHAWDGHQGHEFRMGAGILDAGTAEDFQPRSISVVHQKESDTIVGRYVARAKQLPVSLVIGNCKCRGIQYSQESNGSATVLNVWPSAFADRTQVETIAGRNEFGFGL